MHSSVEGKHDVPHHMSFGDFCLSRISEDLFGYIPGNFAITTGMQLG